MPLPYSWATADSATTAAPRVRTNPLSPGMVRCLSRPCASLAMAGTRCWNWLEEMTAAPRMPRTSILPVILGATQNVGVYRTFGAAHAIVSLSAIPAASWPSPRFNLPRPLYKTSHLEAVARARHQGVQHRHEIDANDQARDHAADDDQGERSLRIGADAGRHRGRQQSKRGDQRRHHDRPQAQERRLVHRLVHRHAVAPQLVDAGNVDHRGQ